jgi:hypothetical protein
VAHAPQRHRGGHCRHTIHDICLFAARPFGATVEVDGNNAFPEGEAALKGART